MSGKKRKRAFGAQARLIARLWGHGDQVKISRHIDATAKDWS